MEKESLQLRFCFERNQVLNAVMSYFRGKSHTQAILTQTLSGTGKSWKKPGVLEICSTQAIKFLEFPI